MAHVPEHNGENPGEHHGLADKLKHPFHELKDMLKNTSLHDTKVALNHKKSVPMHHCVAVFCV
jgi:phospholipase D1/2